MRAVKYGVTRHQVLGLEAVLATGEVIRTGGKFVKATTGYDLTQLIIGSEGTLAIVTEAILQALPAARRTPRRCSRRSARSTRSRPRCRAIVRSGVEPARSSSTSTRRAWPRLTANVGLDLGIPPTCRTRRPAYLVVVLEAAPRRPARRGRSSRSPSCSRELGALDVYVLPPRSAALLLEAREKAFWVAKQNGANDIIDVVVPRASVPEYLATVRGIAERARDVGRAARATPATATCTCRCSRPTTRCGAR